MSAVTAPRRAPSRPADDRRRARRHLRVVEDQPRRRPVLFVTLYLLVSVAVVLGAVSLNALTAGDAVTARELSSRVEVAERRYEQLVAEVATLEDPRRVARIADELGLVPATDPRFLVPGRELPSDTPPADAGADPVKPVLTADGR